MLDAANTLTSSNLYTHVAGFTPVFAPGISHDPVLNSVAVTPANDISSVIKIGTASSVIEYARLVALEDTLVGFNRNSQDGTSQGSLHLGWVFPSNVLVTLGLDLGFRVTIVITSAFAPSVIVLALLDGVVGFIPFEGLRLPATIAAIAGQVAVDQVLLGKREELSIAHGPGRLESRVGREGPTRATLSLVLNSLHVAVTVVVSPVDGLSGHFSLRVVFKVHFFVVHGLVSQDLLVLLSGPVRHMVVAQLEGGLSSIVLLDFAVSTNKL